MKPKSPFHKKKTNIHYQDIFEAANDFRTLYQTSEAINSTLNLDFILHLICKYTNKALRAYRTSVLLYRSETRSVCIVGEYIENEDKKKSKLTSNLKTDKNLATSESFRCIDDEPILIRVIEMKQHLQINSEDVSPSFVSFLFNSRKDICKAVLLVPMIFRDEAIGILVLGDKSSDRKFSQREVNLAYIIANQAAIAIKNAQLFKTAEEEKSQLSSIINSSTDGVIVIDCSLKIVLANPHIEKMFNLEHSKLIGKSFPELMLKSIDSSETDANISDIIRNTSCLSKEVFSQYFKLGPPTKRVIKLTSSPILLSKTEVIGRINIFHDITEEWTLIQQIVKTNEELTTERNRLHTIVDTMTEGLVAVDKNSNIIFFNKSAEYITGYKEKEVLGKNYLDILRGPDYTPHNIMLDSITSSKPDEIETEQNKKIEVASKEDLLLNKDGQLIPVFRSVSGLKDRNNKVIGTMEIFRDIRKEKQAEKMKEEIGNMIVHDMKSPLTSIIASIEMVLQDDYKNFNESQLELLKLAKSSGYQLLGMVNDILDVYRLKEGMMDLQKSETHPELLVQSSIKQVQPLAEKADIDIKTIYHDELPIIKVDDEKIVRVLVNLLNNAIKFTSKGGKIVIETGLYNNEKAGNKLSNFDLHKEQKIQKIYFKVSDTGIGIPKEYQDKIFDKFIAFQSSKVESKLSSLFRSSVGLGLAFCKSVVEAHKGTIWVESEEGKGSTFIFTLPIE